ncbi:ribosome biogenesis GTPase YqeH [Floccifex sp.]|uniref:ribosome biogenesis GTPase YqeH n=1 Tax=Floccifex sp. TaxID=2815810 RepID=UPI002A753FB4|nr:ribosome biogenesis GTPase YqeH [Floccifex sp.]MDD7282262.1 ribosome biogenesis GTPase YqeH [Erysipelotrichaceae bacterium]MDY2958210.1 ribosome biogenesis GTPase YqeH [Floccifex sp.]
MAAYCKGCGVALQNERPKEIGYVPTLDAIYCQRCFKIRNYGDVLISMQQGIESNTTFQKINEIDAVVFWIVDLFAFESSLIPKLNQKLPGKDIIMVLTKRDLLPKTLTIEKISAFVQERLQEEQIVVKDILLSSDLLKNSDEAKESIDFINQAIDYYREDKDVVFMGVANVGKSTILNHLNQNKDLTTSCNPGTTLDLVPIKQDGYTIYDTPGIENHHSILTYLSPKDLKTVIPSKPIRPFVSQIYEDQSFAAAGLARLDIKVKGKASVVAYFSRSISVHRGKLEKADALWQNHLNEMLSPCLDTSLLTMHTYHSKMIDKKMDVVIHGIGWFCISGEIEEVSVKVHKGIYVTFRKAMI